MNRWRSRFFSREERGSALNLTARLTASKSRVPVARSNFRLLAYEAGLHGALCRFQGCRLKDTPDGSSYVVLGRYFRTVVAWARRVFFKEIKSRRLATVRMFTTGETLASVAYIVTACEALIRFVS